MTTAAQTYLDTINALGLTPAQRKGLAARLRQNGVTPGAAIQAARLLVASKVTPAQVDALIADTTWTNNTELRHAISALRQPAAPATPARTTRVSMDAQAAAEESCWAAYRAGRGQRPTGDLVNAVALEIEVSRRAAAPAPAPAPAKLEAAREALAAAEAKAPTAPVVEVRFTDIEGNTAQVPSSGGRGVYTVRLRDGVAYQCGCKHNIIRGLRCKHMAAAEAAYRVCDAQPGTVLRARVELTPKRAQRV